MNDTTAPAPHTFHLLRRPSALRLSLLLLVILLGSTEGAAQQRAELWVMSYNVENLFDTEDDPSKADEDFLPEGSYRWTKTRYYTKLMQVATVISSAREGLYSPDLIGLVEVESARCLEDLLRLQTRLSEEYSYLITEGADRRGIDVALLYRRSVFQLLGWEQIDLQPPSAEPLATRPLLHALGRLPSGDSLHIFVCHFPSRRGGARHSQPYRDHAASILAARCQPLLQQAAEGARCHILILGDFNGSPDETPTRRILGAQPYPSDAAIQASPDKLYYLQPRQGEGEPPGSYCYQGIWSYLDQILASASLLGQESKGLRYLPHSSRVVFFPWLGEQAKERSDFPRPRRSYLGTYYHGGYSDHYPVLAGFSYPLPSEAAK